MPKTRKFDVELDRLRRDADALLLVMITPDRGFISLDSKLTTRDAIRTLRDEIPALEQHLTQRRAR